MPLVRQIVNFLSKHAWPAILWTLAILIACSIPTGEMPQPALPDSDKIAHTLVFGVLCLLWLMVFPKKPMRILLLCVLYGVFIEFYQELTPFGRSFEWLDALADAIGTVLGFLLFLVLRKSLIKEV